MEFLRRSRNVDCVNCVHCGFAIRFAYRGGYSGTLYSRLTCSIERAKVACVWKTVLGYKKFETAVMLVAIFGQNTRYTQIYLIIGTVDKVFQEKIK